MTRPEDICVAPSSKSVETEEVDDVPYDVPPKVVPVPMLDLQPSAVPGVEAF